MSLGQIVASLLGIAFTIGTFGTNASYLWGQGRTLVDVGFLGWIQVSFDVALIFLPWTLGWLWRERRFGWLLVAIFATAICLVAAVFAAAGFVNQNFGDTEAARASAMRQRLALQSDLDDARLERGRLTAAKFERATQAQVDAAKDAVTKECWRKVDSEECKSRRHEHSGLLERLTKTNRADHLNQEIPRLEAVLGATPNIKAADPQIEAIILWASRLSRGGLMFDPRDVEAVRVMTFMCLPLLAGLFFAFGDVLGERRRG